MAKDNKAPAGAPAAKDNVVGMSMCPVEKCGKKATRSEFCEEHFHWFKEGLIARNGMKPKDFDKKYQAFLMRHKKAS